MFDKLTRFMRQRVEVKAHGFIYRGVYLGADDEYVYLKGPASWLTIPMDAISGVKKEGAHEKEWVLRSVEGETEPGQKEREEKRRYRPRDFHRVEPPEDWPEENDNQ